MRSLGILSDEELSPSIRPGNMEFNIEQQQEQGVAFSVLASLMYVVAVVMHIMCMSNIVNIAVLVYYLYHTVFVC